MKRILIMLSTYNGEKYIREQLNSLYAQEGVDIHILVHDDGSNDGTIDVLEQYRKTNGRMTILSESNIGCADSFFTLIKYANNFGGNFSYYAFCDQDDVWLPNKLKVASEKLDTYSEIRKLYFSGAYYVDEKLNYIQEKVVCDKFDYKSCLYNQPALGCTMVFTKSLLECCARAPVPAPELHDAWMFLCVNYLPSRIIADNNPTVNYRQHGDNVSTSIVRSPLLRYIRAFKRRIIQKPGQTSSVVEAFVNTYRIEIDSSKMSFLDCIINYKKSIGNTLRLLREQPFSLCSIFERTCWRMLVILRLL